MAGITIGGFDYSKYILKSGGISITREAVDQDNLDPISSTARVVMSDIDGEISDIFRLPTLSDPNGTRRDRWNRGDLPYVGEFDIEVKIYDDDEVIFGGYVDKESFGGDLLNVDSRDDSRVVSFTVNDYTKHIFKKLDATRLLWSDNANTDLGYAARMLEIPGYSILGSGYSTAEDMPPFHLDDIALDIVKIDIGISSIAFFLSSLNYSMSSDFPVTVHAEGELSNMYIDISKLFMALVYMAKQKNLPTVGGIYKDIGLALYSVFYADSFMNLHIVPREALSHIDRYPAISISDYSVISREGTYQGKIQYVRDIYSDEMAVGGRPFGNTRADDLGLKNDWINGDRTAWYYMVNVPVLNREGRWVTSNEIRWIVGDQQQPDGSIYDAIPAIATGGMYHRGYARLFMKKLPSGHYMRTFDGRGNVDRNTILGYTLKPPARLKIKTPGVRFYQYQRVILENETEWRIVSGDIDCMDKSSELILERIK